MYRYFNFVLIIISFKLVSCHYAPKETKDTQKNIAPPEIDALDLDKLSFHANDSLTIALWLDLLNEEFIDEETQEIQGNIGYGIGKVWEDPYKNFKIFNFQGEGCGANCSSFNTSYLQWSHGKIDSLKLPFGTINSLNYINPNSYVIVSSFYSGGLIGGSTYQLHLMQTHNQNIEFITFDSKISALEKYISEDQKTFSFFSHWSCMTNAGIHFNPYNQTFYFSYKPSYSDENLFKSFNISLTEIETDKEFAIIGSFQIKDNQISAFEEKFEWIKDESHALSLDLSNSKTNIFITKHQGYTLFYDCIHCSPTVNEAIIVKSTKGDSTKTLFTTTIFDQYLSDIKLFTWQKQAFIFLETSHTYGHSEGYLYAWDTQKNTTTSIPYENPKLHLTDSLVYRKYFGLTHKEHHLFYTTHYTRSKVSGLDYFFTNTFELKKSKNGYFLALLFSEP